MDGKSGETCQMNILTLMFKGDRDYIQGGDIYNVLCDTALERYEQGYVSSIVFKCFARNQCCLSFQPMEGGGALLATGKMLEKGEIAHEFWLYESSEPVVERYPFDEGAIVREASVDIDGKRISRAECASYSAIEQIIALTKKLSYSLYPEVDGKWVFGQLNLHAPLAAQGDLEIIQRSALSGRFSINDIVQSGLPVGSIRFVVGKP